MDGQQFGPYYRIDIQPIMVPQEVMDKKGNLVNQSTHLVMPIRTFFPIMVWIYYYFIFMFFFFFGWDDDDAGGEKKSTRRKQKRERDSSKSLLVKQKVCFFFFFCIKVL